MRTQPRIGVYVCHCGLNIASAVDVEAVTDFAAHLPGVAVARHYVYMCSEPGQSLVKQDCRELGLKQVVVASCSPRMHEPTFRAAAQEGGVNPYRVEMANIREQCAWVHKDREEATAKARSLLASAVAKAGLLESLERREVSVTPGAVVVGGGVAGLSAALDIAEAGFPVCLVEKSDRLGGRAADLSFTFPDLEPAAAWLPDLIQRVETHPNIKVLLGAQVAQIDGYVGNFSVRVQAGSECALNVGAVVVATGYDVFDAAARPELGYGRYPQVITTLDLERRLAAGDLAAQGAAPRDIAFIQCVGSRDVQVGRPYCSRVCCSAVAKQARLLRERLPESRVTVFYMDTRTFGKRGEELYDEARKAGVLYRRGNVSEIFRRGDRVAVRVEDTNLRRVIEHPADLVVLAVGMGPRADAANISALFKLPLSADGFFLEAHPKLRPVDTATDGVFLGGCCQGPKDISDAIAQGKAAASSALIPLLHGTVPVESATAMVDRAQCAECGLCVSVCPFGAPALDPVWRSSVVNAVLCKGCGTCAALCPSKAIHLQHFTPAQIMAQIDALV